MDNDILTDLRLAVARLEVQTRNINEKLDTAVVSREQLEARLAPITEYMNRWKGALTMIVLIAGAAGAAVTTGIRQLLNGANP